MPKFTDWIEEWKSQYKEETNCEVLKADISIILKNAADEIIIRKSAYKSKNMPKIKLANEPQNTVLCG
jgi:hypothetical protein